MASKDFYVLIPRTCEYVTSHLKRNLKWGDYSKLSGWTQCNHKGPYKLKGEAIESESEKMW